MPPKSPPRPVSVLKVQKRRLPWKRLTVLLLAINLVAAFINGWSWLPTGRSTVRKVQQQAAKLPVISSLKGKVIFISPHPDDETLAAGGLLQDIQAKGGQVYVVFLTSGDGFALDARVTHRSVTATPAEMLRLGNHRMQEARNATQLLGIPQDHIYFLGFPDRGLNAIYLQNYLTPLTSPFTKVNHVPYSGTVKPGAPYTGRELEDLLGEVFYHISPDVVLAPTFFDGHPDHRTAAYLSTRLASLYGARLYFYMVHGGVEWPLPKGLHQELPLSPPQQSLQGVQWNRYLLTSEQQTRKIAAIKAYQSQLKVIPRFMWAFVRQNELLLPAPIPSAHELGLQESTVHTPKVHAPKVHAPKVQRPTVQASTVQLLSESHGAALRSRYTGSD